jgi:hypothetical protein
MKQIIKFYIKVKYLSSHKEFELYWEEKDLTKNFNSI